MMFRRGHGRDPSSPERSSSRTAGNAEGALQKTRVEIVFDTSGAPWIEAANSERGW